MSGIAALINTDGSPAARQVMEAMTSALDYRGPDGIAAWVSGPVAIGHCAMHTTFESLGHCQPLTTEDGQVALSFDGFLANRDELALELAQRGSRLRDGSDAELVLRAWEAWGEDCPVHLDGEFALVLWDGRRKLAFASRDHVGLRSLFYHWDGTRLLVASDVAGVLAALEVPPTLNRGYLAEVCADMYLTADETAWTGVMRLPAAHRLVVQAGRLRSDQYWHVPQDVTIRYRRDEDYAEHYRAVLTDCVRRASRTHLPLAFEVSGGLDSTSVYAMAKRLQDEGRLLAPAMQGYTFAAPPGTAADELSHVAAFEDHLGIKLRHMPLFMPDMAWFEERSRQDRDLAPFGNSAMFEELRQGLVSDGSRVVLNGQGGDMWLDGTRFYYHEMLRGLAFGELARAIRRDAASLGAGQTASLLLHAGLSPFLSAGAARLLRQLLRQPIASSLQPPYWLASDLQRELVRRHREAIARRKRPIAEYKSAKAHKPSFVRIWDPVSRMQARGGCESRSPMLSRAFIEFSARTPESIKRRGATTKWIHRRAMRGFLPQCIIDRPDKAEFSVVYDHHLEYLEKIFCEELPIDPLGMFEPSQTCNLHRRYCTAAIDGTTIWELWGSYAVSLMAR